MCIVSKYINDHNTTPSTTDQGELNTQGLLVYKTRKSISSFEEKNFSPSTIFIHLLFSSVNDGIVSISRLFKYLLVLESQSRYGPVIILDFSC